MASRRSRSEIFRGGDGAKARQIHPETVRVSPVALEAGKREKLLDALEDLARADFGGVVTRNMTTSVFIGKRE